MTKKPEEIFNLIGDRRSKVAQSCPTLCNPMDCSLPGSSVHGIFQAIILEWVAISFSRGSSQPRDQTWVSCTVGICFHHLCQQGSSNANKNNNGMQFLTMQIAKSSMKALSDTKYFLQTEDESLENECSCIPVKA